MQSGAVERKIDIRKRRMLGESPKGALRMASSGAMFALSSFFINNSTHIH